MISLNGWYGIEETRRLSSGTNLTIIKGLNQDAKLDGIRLLVI
jgi:hypothetical protein